MVNELVANSPRLGWYVDGLPDEVTAPTATMLNDDGSRITLTIPWRSEGGPERQFERWFGGQMIHWGDDPERTRYSYELPTELGFQDADGPVALVGCQAGGYRSNFGGTNAAQGIVYVQFAVLGATSLVWDRINGLRTYLPELGDWMGLTSLAQRETRGDDGRLRQFELTLDAMPEIQLARRLNVRAVPTWRVEPYRFGPHQLYDESYLQTSATRPRSWEEHFEVHQSVRELLDVAAWQAFGNREITANRSDDPIRAMSGDVLDERWCDVRTYTVRRARESSARPNYLFRFSDIGSSGYRRWLAPRSKFARGVDPILSLLNLEKALRSNLVTQTSLGLEAIAYELALESGMSERKAGNLRFKDRMSLIHSKLAAPTVSKEWPARAADTYNGIKHADRPLPDQLSMRAVAEENTLVFRTWIASRIGVGKQVLQRNLQYDPTRQSLDNLGFSVEP